MVGTHKGTYTYSRLSEKCYVPMYVNYPYVDEPPTITATRLPDACLNEPYYAKIGATGTKPITFSGWTATLQANGFDIGAMLVGSDTSDIIKGTPKNPSNRAAPYTLYFTVTAPGLSTSCSGNKCYLNGRPTRSGRYSLSIAVTYAKGNSTSST